MIIESYCNLQFQDILFTWAAFDYFEEDSLTMVVISQMKGTSQIIDTEGGSLTSGADATGHCVSVQVTEDTYKMPTSVTLRVSPHAFQVLQ